jgi:hypothetical protein
VRLRFERVQLLGNSVGCCRGLLELIIGTFENQNRPRNGRMSRFSNCGRRRALLSTIQTFLTLILCPSGYLFMPSVGAVTSGRR